MNSMLNLDKTARILAALLALQLVLVVVSLSGGDRYSAFHGSEPLLGELNIKDLDRITIASSGADASELELRARDGGWQLPGLDDLPAASASVQRLLDRLTAMKRGWPVAETESAAERFQVADDKFERRIRLFQGDQQRAELYLGSSPGFRQVHARVAGEQAIHNVEFNNFEAGLKPEDWLDTGLLQHPEETIRRLRVNDLELVRKDDGLTLTGLADNETLVQDEASKLLRRVAQISVTTSLGREAKPEFGLDTPTLEIQLELESGEIFNYRIGAKDGDRYVLKSDQRPEYFALSTWVVDPILEIDRNKLLGMETTTVPSPQALEAPSAPPEGDADSPLVQPPTLEQPTMPDAQLMPRVEPAPDTEADNASLADPA